MEKAYRCTNCGGLYEVMVSQCDCMPQQQQFVEQAVMPWADAVQLTAERDRLRNALLGGIQHRYLGDCPDPLDNTRRDKDCPACLILLQEAK